ncbi:MAG TPA: hypothetical protein VIH21_09110 [Dehalococcoidia bacterium]|jgi:hypothetical protein
MSVYEYRTMRIARASWPRIADALFGGVEEETRAAGGSLFALCAGMIGLASDEGVLIRTWPDEATLAQHADPTIAFADMVVESSYEPLLPTVRPRDGAPPRTAGVYAHRWFWLATQDWPEFERLSEDGVWPYFESDGCEIIGLWRANEPAPMTRALLLTRYPSVAHWERTRLQSAEPPPGADAGLYRRAQDAGRRRAELTQRSIVRLTRILLPRS